MIAFKGFDGWIEIFKGGWQTDSNGKAHDGDKLIDQAVSSFDADKHEPPIVVGHPKENAPAFGWVTELKTKIRDGSKHLLAKFKDVAPEFEAWVKEGRYRKRSASFYPDGRLRHVGFLGAAPPAIKGLSDVRFSNDSDLIEFSYDQADSNTKAFSEADLQAAVQRERDNIYREFSEKERKANIRTFVENLRDKGVVAPAIADYGLIEFMETLDADRVIEFSEGEKQTPLEWFMDVMKKKLPSYLFTEFATKERAAPPRAQGEEEEHLGKEMAEQVNPQKPE